MSDVVPISVRKRIVDLLLVRLEGDDSTPRPAYLGNVKLSKNRGTAIGGDELPLYSIYFLSNRPTPVGGDPRRAVLNSNELLIECRVIVKGNDDAADPHCIWVTDRIIGADRCPDEAGSYLALGITEDETPFEPMEGAQAEVTVTRMRFVVKYTTNRIDITKGV